MPSGPLGAMENPIGCPDSKDKDEEPKRPRVAPTPMLTVAMPTGSETGPSETRPKVEPLSWEEARASFNKELQPIVESKELQPIIEFGEPVAKPMDNHKEGILSVLAQYKLTGM